MSLIVNYLNSAQKYLKKAKSVISSNHIVPDGVDPADRKFYLMKDRLGINDRFDHRQLEHLYTNQYPEAMALLATGNYSQHFFQGTYLNLAYAEGLANAHNGGDNRILIQSIFDAEVADKRTTIDEYAVTVNLPEGMSPNGFLLQMAGDMSGTLGGEFDDLGEFKNLGENPEVGQVIDIDVEDGPRIFGKKIPFMESPFNAPIIITDMQDNSFTVQTIEFNGNEHVLHGTRQWGFEEMSDGSHRFYTRAVSVEDIQAAEGIPGLGNAKNGEYRFWNSWIDGVENYVSDHGGSIVEGTRVAEQTSGPTGNEIWNTLAQEQQDLVRNSQVSGLERELEHRRDHLPRAGHPRQTPIRGLEGLQDKISDWETR